MQKKIRLGVNIDHFATLRNVRNDEEIELSEIVNIIKKADADSITVHLREDRRHIKDKDVIQLIKQKLLPLNLEMAATSEMQKICIENKPFACCIVPEKREELTTEGGLDVFKQKDHLLKIIEPLKKRKIRVAFFIEPDFKQIEASKEVGANAIEIHTGTYANNFKKKNFQADLKKIKDAARYAEKLNLECHAGHGLNIDNVSYISEISQVMELNVGYSLVCDSLIFGLDNSIKSFIKKINHY
ncbi:pyridoxine 5'-phosphate synthase [Rickettsiales bacterium]|nr:pyridoxine 5'-phosphate synthase [Rickettsiales bacterium]